MSADADGLAELLTIEEVAERLRVSVLTVRWLRQEGRFVPAIKVGRRLMWDTRDVAAWLKSQRETPKVALWVFSVTSCRPEPCATGRGSSRMAVCRNPRFRAEDRRCGLGTGPAAATSPWGVNRSAPGPGSAVGRGGRLAGFAWLGQAPDP